MIGGNMERLDQGRIQVARPYRDLLQANHLGTLDEVMAFQGGDMMRSVPGRSTLRIQLQRSDGSHQIAFLKRYDPTYLTPAKRVFRWCGLSSAQDEAQHEWNMIHVLRERGFLLPEPIACGQRKCCRLGGLVTHSFLLTAEIPGGIAAHQYVKSLEVKARRHLLRQIGRLTHRFHSEGFAHKDYYLNHILVVPQPDEPKLYLIDLQRAIGPGRFHQRGRIKDLAALAYSVQLAGAARTDLGHFFRESFALPRLLEKDKPLLRQICRRMAWLHQRRPKHDAIWDQPGIRPPNV
jgi:tRNA A-37 threonylcarbamoyl transferase component Bud32